MRPNSIDKIYYRIFMGLLFMALLAGFMGEGLSSGKVNPQHPYLSFLKRIRFFDVQQYSRERTHEVNKDLGLWREKIRQQGYTRHERLQEQNWDLTRLKERRLNQSLTFSNKTQGYRDDIQDKIRQQYDRNRDIQNSYRNFMASQRK